VALPVIDAGSGHAALYGCKVTTVADIPIFAEPPPKVRASA